MDRFFALMYKPGSNEPHTPSPIQPPPTTPVDPPTPGSPDHRPAVLTTDMRDGMDIGYTSQGGVVSPPVVEEHQQEAKEKPKSIASSKQKRRGNLSRKRKLGRFQFQPQLVLENNGSVARDHLASERTFLAYVRTSLSLATTGVGLVQLFTVASQATPPNPISPKVQNFARPLGSTLVLFGFVVLLLGVYRYFVNQTALTQGHITVARISVYAITLILSTIVIIVFAVLVSAQ